MKKIIALLLVAVMCLSFVACNNESGNTEAPSSGENTENNGSSTNGTNKILGTWKTDPSYNNYVLIINDNNTGSLSVGGETDVLTWTYDIETCTLTLIKESSPDSPMTLTYVESNDTLISAGPTFRRAETFPEKIERGTVTTSENPLLPILFQTLADEGWSYTFNEDGTCGDQVYWWIESDTEKSMTIMVASEYKWKYQIGIAYSAPYLLIQADDAMYMGDDFVAWQPPLEVYRVPYSTSDNFGSLCDTWYANDSSKAPIQTILIKSSGKCVLDEQVATWDYYADGSNEPDQLDIVISIGEKEVYLGVLIGEDVFWLMPMDGSIGGEYSKARN